MPTENSMTTNQAHKAQKIPMIIRSSKDILPIGPFKIVIELSADSHSTVDYIYENIIRSLNRVAYGDGSQSIGAKIKLC